jgi:DNA polymerase I
VVEARWEPSGKLSFPQCCNLPVQGAAADAMLRAIALVHRRLRGLQGGLVACVHDELLLEVAEGDAEAARQILEEAMVEAFELTFPGAPTCGVVAAAVGRTWKEAKG